MKRRHIFSPAHKEAQIREKNRRSFSCQDVPIISLPLASRSATLQKGVSQRRRQNPMPPLPTLIFCAHPPLFLLTGQVRQITLPFPPPPPPPSSDSHKQLSQPPPSRSYPPFISLFLSPRRFCLPPNERRTDFVRSKVSGVLLIGVVSLFCALRVASARFFPCLSWAIFGFWVTGPRFPESLFHLFARCMP